MSRPALFPGEIHLDPFERRHVGRDGAFVLRINREHVAIARAAVALRLDVPVGAITVDWKAARASVPVKLRRAA